MMCANCTAKVVGGKGHSRESVLCVKCCAEALERHDRARVDLLRLRAQNDEPTFLNID
jgi:hypothetical protein